MAPPRASKSDPVRDSPLTMSLGDHLEELRKRVLLSIAAPLPLFILIFLVGSDALNH